MPQSPASSTPETRTPKLQTLSSINDTDFGRSFLRFRTNRVNHTPRLNLAASCTIASPGQASLTYHLSVACIAENMYLPKGHIQEPVAEFNIVQLPQTEFMFLRRHADAKSDVRRTQQIGETLPTHDGRGATLLETDAHISRFKRVTPITTYAAFRDALLNNHPINGRTTCTDTDGKTVLTFDYPVNTGNVRHDQESWQVDAGPILMPVRAQEPGSLLITRFDMAFIVYNTWDYAEAALCEESPVGSDGKTNFYRRLVGFPCRNEMFLCQD